MLFKKSAKQQWYQKERKLKQELINLQINRDYLKLIKQDKSTSFIMSYLRNKYKNGKGEPCSKQRIYNALDLKNIDKEIRATQGCDPLQGA